ncbi:hypothetical protein THRCLA_10872 [Thraustotheca clavata]|uniref:Uncharacterized protein n=1 Tax=Thraustotheca clavata TaxID=74557 RepID=A0A1V9YED9_9STRA|nr:hypothetical protein THRCLA_10872 [Thraustotheca clavata]
MDEAVIARKDETRCGEPAISHIPIEPHIEETEEICELKTALESTQLELEETKLKCQTYWEQRCAAIIQVSVILKDNKKLQQEIFVLKDKAICLEREVMKLENRLVHAQTSLRNYVQERKERRISNPNQLVAIKRSSSNNYVASLPEEQKDTDFYEQKIRTLTDEVQKFHGINEMYQRTLESLRVKELQVQYMEEGQRDERELIASLRQSVEKLKQNNQELELEKSRRSVSMDLLHAIFCRMNHFPDAKHQPDFNATSLEMTLVQVTQLLDELIQRKRISWLEHPSVFSIPKLPEALSSSSCGTPDLRSFTSSPLKCLRSILPCAKEADFMGLTDWLHHTARCTGLNRPFQLHGLSSHEVQCVITRLAPLIQSQLSVSLSVQLTEMVVYRTNLTLTSEQDKI